MKPKCTTNNCFGSAFKNGKCALCMPHKRMSQYSHSPIPRTSRPHIGIEAEMFGSDIQALLNICPYTGHEDGSIDGGVEFKALYTQNEAIRRVPPVFEQLRQAGAYVTQACGLHVHLDMRGVPAAKIDDGLEWLYKTQHYWFSIMPPSRRSNQYVVKWRYSWGAAYRAYANDHYVWANNGRQDTIEVRIHPGTVNPYKVEGWLCVMRDLRNHIEKGELPDLDHLNARDAVLQIAINPTGRDYLLARERGCGVLKQTRPMINNYEEDI